MVSQERTGRFESPDDEAYLAQSLATLARRADGHALVDSMPAVRRRARRNAAVRAVGATLSVALLAGGATVVGSRLVGGARLTTPLPPAASTAPPSPSATATGRAPADRISGSEPPGAAAFLDRTYTTTCGGGSQEVALRGGSGDFVDSGGVTRTVTAVVRDLSALTSEGSDLSSPRPSGSGRVAVVLACRAEGRPAADSLLVFDGTDPAAAAPQTPVRAQEGLRITDLYPAPTSGRLVVLATGTDQEGRPQAVVRTVDLCCTSQAVEDNFRYPLPSPQAQPLDVAPFLSVAVRKESGSGRSVVVQPRAVGIVPVPTVDGTAVDRADVADGTFGLRRFEVDWGDGSPRYGTNPSGDTVCPSPSGSSGRAAVLVGGDRLVHDYAEPGTYTITLLTAACDPLGERTATLQVTVA